MSRSDEERTRALAKLNQRLRSPVTLPRRVYFVPGWRDEQGACWKRMEKWLPKLVANYATHVTFVQFEAVDGSFAPPWEDFLDFGDDLAELVRADAAAHAGDVDFVSHSMGGLDVAAAIALLGPSHPELPAPPIRSAGAVITYDTPFAGFGAAKSELFKKFVSSGRADPWVKLQLGAMEKDSKRIAELALARGAFLEHLDAFWPRGADNYDGILEVPHESASFGEPADFPSAVRDRYRGYRIWPDTSHSGTNGVTNDVRVVREVLEILTGVPL